MTHVGGREKIKKNDTFVAQKTADGRVEIKTKTTSSWPLAIAVGGEEIEKRHLDGSKDC